LHLHFEANANAAGRRHLKFAIGSRAAGSSMKKKKQIGDRISEREYHDRLRSLMKNEINTQLEPLRSLKTATKKRRELKPRACAK
jgi:hypothetical protein